MDESEEIKAEIIEVDTPVMGPIATARPGHEITLTVQCSPRVLAALTSYLVDCKQAVLTPQGLLIT